MKYVHVQKFHCGSRVIERRTFTADGPVIVSMVCDCGHVLDSFTLSFSKASRSRAEDVPSRTAAASGPVAAFLERLDEERSNWRPFSLAS